MRPLPTACRPLLLVSLLLSCMWTLPLCVVHGKLVSGFRPPAIPLFAISPTLSVWQRSDRITQEQPSHWIPREHNMTMTGYLMLDDAPYRFLGVDPIGPTTASFSVPAMDQLELLVQPTQTIVTLRSPDRRVQLVLTFTQPALPDDLFQLSRPLAYITHEVTVLDGAAHRVYVYVDQVGDFIANTLTDQIVWQDLSTAFHRHAGQTRSGAVVLSQRNYGKEQTHYAQPFGVNGDEVKNNWGVLYAATDSPQLASCTIANASAARQSFLSSPSSALPVFDTSQPRGVSDGWIVSAFVFDYGIVTASTVSSYLVIAHDEMLAVNYYSQYLQPLWKRTYAQSWQRLLADAFQDYTEVRSRADRYDADLIQQASQVSDEYATLCALIHRQVLSMIVVVWDAQREAERVFMLEPTTSGATNTIDVIFPSSPFFLYLAPDVLRLLLLPILDFASNQTFISWTLPYAPHTLGYWPVANVFPLWELNHFNSMPMEETADIFLMLTALAKTQAGQVDYLIRYKALLESWAEYLAASLPDPPFQFCTDDFEGPSAHNVNLALKGILGISAYSQLLVYLNDLPRAAHYRALVPPLVTAWQKLAAEDFSAATQSDAAYLPHYRLQYDLNETWSLKYNLMWQYALNLTAFPDSVRLTELAFYQSKLQPYGLPLDCRNDFGKLDWESFIAALAFDSPSLRARIIHALYQFANETPLRFPLEDWHNTTYNTGHPTGFIARPVVGQPHPRPI